MRRVELDDRDSSNTAARVVCDDNGGGGTVDFSGSGGGVVSGGGGGATDAVGDVSMNAVVQHARESRVAEAAEWRPWVRL